MERISPMDDIGYKLAMFLDDVERMPDDIRRGLLYDSEGKSRLDFSKMFRVGRGRAPAAP